MEALSKSAVRSILRVSVPVLITGAICGSTVAFVQIDEVLGKVRQGAEQVSANNAAFYLKSAKAVEPNICLYPSGDPTGITGPISYKEKS